MAKPGHRVGDAQAHEVRLELDRLFIFVQSTSTPLLALLLLYLVGYRLSQTDHGFGHLHQLVDVLEGFGDFRVCLLQFLLHGLLDSTDATGARGCGRFPHMSNNLDLPASVGQSFVELATELFLATLLERQLAVGLLGGRYGH